jgi:hypothetical protein
LSVFHTQYSSLFPILPLEILHAFSSKSVPITLLIKLKISKFNNLGLNPLEFRLVSGHYMGGLQVNFIIFSSKFKTNSYISNEPQANRCTRVKLHRISEKREKCFNLTHISANGNEDGIVKYLKRNQIHKDRKTFYFSNGAQTTSLSFSLKLKSTFKSKKPRQQLSLYLLLGLIYDQRF